MKRLIFLVGLLGLVCPAVGWAQSQLTASALTRVNTPDYLERQILRCDESESIAGPTGPVAGEANGACSSGDWTLPTDCRGKPNLRLMFFEYGAGSGEFKFWGCRLVRDAARTIDGTADGGTIPGTEAPGSAPSAADPDPLCVDLTLAAGITMLGTPASTQFLNLSNQNLDFVVGELQACTGDCDSTAFVSCGR